MTTADLETLGGPEHEPEPAVAPDGSTKWITGRSPFRIAMDRLLRDKVAVTCATIAALIFLAALFEPVITNLWNISTAPNHPGHQPRPVRLPAGRPAEPRVHLVTPAGPGHHARR